MLDFTPCLCMTTIWLDRGPSFLNENKYFTTVLLLLCCHQHIRLVMGCRPMILEWESDVIVTNRDLLALDPILKKVKVKSILQPYCYLSLCHAVYSIVVWNSIFKKSVRFFFSHFTMPQNFRGPFFRSRFQWAIPWGTSCGSIVSLLQGWGGFSIVPAKKMRR